MSAAVAGRVLVSAGRPFVASGVSVASHVDSCRALMSRHALDFAISRASVDSCQPFPSRSGALVRPLLGMPLA